MLRIFRVDHQRKLEEDNLRYEYIDVDKDTNIQKKYIKIKPKRMSSFPDIELYLENYVVWNEEGLLLGSIKNDVQIKIEESELFKVFYGYWETQDLPVVAFYLNDEELKLLKEANQATNVRYEYFDEDSVDSCYSGDWYLFPGKVDMGFSYALKYTSSVKDRSGKSTSRMFYFTDNGKIYCGTTGMRHCCIEVKQILDCPKAGYDISSKVYKFTLPTDIELQMAKSDAKFLAAQLEKSIKFLDLVIEPGDLYNRKRKRD
ncbi:hypothetical protein SBY92_001180 [Candida maltosa Xu316]|uniref:Uncharacterized protein n=1 Tax=Candida maltosa (strain Xu316) TaxID=1245528 RepID=M3IIE4_CANMX|nr:hypothetical protein G210_3665 [Candida maltosa Xu316]